jgi:hypothetical protein
MKLVFKGERHNRIVSGLDKLHCKETKAQEKYLSVVEFHAKSPRELPFLTLTHCGAIFPLAKHASEQESLCVRDLPVLIRGVELIVTFVDNQLPDYDFVRIRSSYTVGQVFHYLDLVGQPCHKGQQARQATNQAYGAKQTEEHGLIAGEKRDSFLRYLLPQGKS